MEYCTIGQLRSELDRLESEWGDMEDMFGPFNAQQVITDHYDALPTSAQKYLGLGPVRVVPYWELGLCILPTKPGSDLD